jgi:hypothetical protein
VLLLKARIVDNALPFLPASISTPRSDARHEERGERNCKIAKESSRKPNAYGRIQSI